jgi:hypothetical protein
MVCASPGSKKATPGMSVRTWTISETSATTLDAAVTEFGL